MAPPFAVNPLLWIRAVALFCNSFVIATIHTLVMIPIYPIKFIFPNLYVTMEAFLYATCGESLIPAFLLAPRLRIYCDTIREIEPITRQRAVVTVNHQDSGDVPTMMAVVTYFKIAHCSTWIMDRMFRWTQFGVPSQWHNDFFSKEGSKEAVIKQIRNHYSTTYWERGHKWCIFFPEGGFLKNRGESARRWAIANGLPPLYKCCTPRATAFTNIVQAFRGEVRPVPGSVDDVVDVTLAFKGPTVLSVGDVVKGTYSDKEVYINFRTWKMADLPTEQAALEQWLYDRFLEKEEMLKRFDETGEFTPNSTFTLLDLPKGRLLGNIVFWYILAFFIFDFYYCILGNLWRFSSGLVL